MNLSDFKLKEKPLSMLCLMTNGSTKDQSKEISEYPITRIETISSGTIDKNRVNYVEFSIKEIECYKLNEGDILFSHINSFERVGHCAIVKKTDLPIYHGMNLLRIQADLKEVISEYLFLYLKSSYAKRFYEEFSQRAINQASINQNTLKALKVIFPEKISDQQRIATEIKQKLTAIEQMQQTALEQKEAVEALQGALLREVFPYKEGDKLPKGWKWEKIENLIDKKIKPFLKKGDGEFIYIDISSIDNYHKKIIDPKKLLIKDAPSRAKSILQEGDIILSNVRPNLNAVSIINSEYTGSIGSSGFTVIRPLDNYLTGFLFLFFTSPCFIDYVTDLVQGAMYPAMSEKDVYKCSIPVPNPATQAEIYHSTSKKLSKIYNLKKQSKTQLEAIEALPAAILREVFEFKS